MPLDRFLATTPDFTDFEHADTFLRPASPEENLAEFEQHNKRNTELLVKIEESRGMQEAEIVRLFSSTHHVPRQSMDIVNVMEEITDHDLVTWQNNFSYSITQDDLMLGKQKVVNVIEESGRIPADEVIPKEYSE